MKFLIFRTPALHEWRHLFALYPADELFGFGVFGLRLRDRQPEPVEVGLLSQENRTVARVRAETEEGMPWRLRHGPRSAP